MSISINWLIILITVLAYSTFFLVSRIIINKFSTLDEIFIRNNKRLATIISLVNGSFSASMESLRIIKDLRQNLELKALSSQPRSNKVLRFESKELMKLKARSALRRKEAATALAIIGSEEARTALEHALATETDYSVKIYISNALTDIRREQSLEIMINALIGTHKWYRERAISNILEFGSDFHPHFQRMKETRDIEWIELLIKYSGENFNNDTKAYLFSFVDEFDRILEEARSKYQEKEKKRQTRYKPQYLDKDMDALLGTACRSLANYYYPEFSTERYWTSANPIIRINSYWALSRQNSTANFKTLLYHMTDAPYEKTLIDAATKMLESNPRFIYLVEEAFEAETDEAVKARLAQILSNRIEYYILQLDSKQGNRAKEILKQIIRNERINEMIGFLNLNKDKDIQNTLLHIIKENVDPGSGIGIELRTYLKDPLLAEWGQERYKENQNARLHGKDKKLIRVVAVATVLGFFTIPAIFVARYWSVLTVWSPLELLERYVIEFNYELAYYSIAVSLSYLVLMRLSYKNVKKQARLWNLKNISMLFRNKMIPAISIIAPAYNEEMTIVSSVKSLLNLKYPDYELIVVNDGSKDEMLNKLIEAFRLVRVNYRYTASLQTAPIRGIYRNPSLPKLVVIDKSNGGKADALNAGINVANKEYFCGIDSDSLLEPEALLKLASLTLDESTETPALGGNVFPINGCEVDNGLITKIRIPKSHLARFQNIEYLRAFMVGRLGWQQINSLLIISGAFGLFRKERIIGIGGYMTTLGKYRKDTVGEDMELVVRISRLMHEMGLRFKILYAYNANCWTQVPEDMKSLKTQRYRWHRGLIDIMFFHKKLIWNPKYKHTGMLAMPYYLLFETLGPMIEAQGYLMVVIAALLGILDGRIALLLFIGTVFFGIINSISAVLIAEREDQYFTPLDMTKLLLYALIENFGPRQWISFWRIRGQFNVIFGKGGWGKIKRKGLG
jgi:cellulose synthase/poly-beta-1,6-N-acetylglucosamine synthase-like glycosyltransferase